MKRKNSVLADACLEAAIDLAQEAEEKFADTDDFVTTPDFDEKMQKLIKKVESGAYSPVRRRARVILIAAIIVAVSIFSCWAIFEGAALEKPYTINVYDKWSTVEYIGDCSDYCYSTADYSINEDCIPDGYECSEKIINDIENVYVYENSEGSRIVIHKSQGRCKTNINTEFYPYEEVIIDGNWVIIFKCPDNGSNIYNAMYFKNGVKYSISGVSDRDELVKIIKKLN